MKLSEIVNQPLALKEFRTSHEISLLETAAMIRLPGEYVRKSQERKMTLPESDLNRLCRTLETAYKQSLQNDTL